MRRLFTAGLLLLIAVAIDGTSLSKKFRWCVYYSDKAPIQSFYEFDLLVFDSDHHPQLSPLAGRGKTLLGYLSLGEVENYRSHSADLKEEGILLGENENWKGSYFVDLRDQRWTRRVVERLIPSILDQGFHGLFLDTLDDPIELERINPEKYSGMTAAAVALIGEIRRRYPSIKIMMNRGYELLPQVERQIDFVLGESVYADYDLQSRTYRWVPQDEYTSQVELLRAAKGRCPGLRVFTLDYWSFRDPAGIRRIYRTQRANGFEPYVATIELNLIVREPK